MGSYKLIATVPAMRASVRWTRAAARCHALRSLNQGGAQLPTSASSNKWWARRKSAFAHPSACFAEDVDAGTAGMTMKLAYEPSNLNETFILGTSTLPWRPIAKSLDDFGDAQLAQGFSGLLTAAEAAFPQDSPVPISSITL